MKLSCILSISILVVFGSAQEWVARYNGPANAVDAASAIAVDNAGNVYVTGWSYGTGMDYATLKYNASGSQRWVARYDGPIGSYDEAYGLAIDSVGNVYVTGKSYGVGTYYDYATVMYDSSGGQQWASRYVGLGGSHDEARAIAVDMEGNVYVTGAIFAANYTMNYGTIKYDSGGAEQWVAQYNGPVSDDEARDLAIDDSANIYVTGFSYGAGTGVDYATVKYDSAGTEKWVARYNGPGNNTDEAYAVAVDENGNVYVTGVSYTSATYNDYATVKYNASGSQRWVARYNGPGNGPDYAYAIAVDNAGNVYVTGRSYDPASDYDYATVKYDSAGSQQWVARYDGPGSSHDEAYAITVGNGNVFVTGRSYGSITDVDYATVKYDTSGNEKWVMRYDGPGSLSDEACAITVDSAGNTYVTGKSTGLSSDYDYTTMKYSYTITIYEQGKNIILPLNGGRPTMVAAQLSGLYGEKYTVFDVAGREVMLDKIQPGVYFLWVENANYVTAFKIIMIR